jgi:signal transduction histidine kinase/ActR/RegA family two-component response regulator
MDATVALRHTLGGINFEASHGDAADGADISASKLAELIRKKLLAIKALQDDSLKLHVLEEDLCEFLLVASQEGPVLTANRELIKFLGMSADQLKAEDYCQVLSRFTSEQPTEPLKAAARFGQRFEATLRRSGVHEVPVTGRFAALDLSSGPVFVFCFRDRSEEYSAQRALEAALADAQRSGDMRARFLANMSHEIRTPLNGLSGMIDLLEDSPLTPEQTDRVRLLKASAKRLMTLLVDILDFSKIEAGHMAIESITFDLSAKAEQCFKLFEPLASSKGIDLRFVTNLKQIHVTSDPNRLMQIISNLMDNALKFTKSGSVVLRIETEMDMSDSDYCHCIISVQDTGVGIEASSLPKLFTPFTQSDESISRKYGGTGLGLALCKQLIELMGGSIQVESTLGVGSVFTARLRTLIGYGAGFQDTSPGESVEESRPEILEGKSILLVDDNDINQALVATWLKKRGAKVTLASDGESGIRHAMQESFDAILMDVAMPRLSGIDATKLLRATSLTNPQRYGYLRRVPILGVTAYAMQSDREACLNAGMNDHMSKPLNQQVLVARLSSLIERNTH